MEGEKLEIKQFDLADFAKGNFIHNFEDKEVEEKGAEISFKGMVNLFIQLKKEYKDKGKVNKKAFLKMFEESRDEVNKELHDYEENVDISKYYSVSDRKEVGDEIIVKFKKINETEHVKIVKEITKKLIDKMTPEQMKIMIQEGIKKNNSTDLLKKINKKLDKEKPEIKGRRGCFYLTIGGEDLFLVG